MSEKPDFPKFSFNDEEMQKKLEPGWMSEAGFLKKGEIFEEIVWEDEQIIKSLDTSYEEIAKKLVRLMMAALDRKKTMAILNPKNSEGNMVDLTLDGTKYEVKIQQWRGFQENPFGDRFPPRYLSDDFNFHCSRDFEVKNVETGDEIFFPGMAPYLIGDVHFFEGHTKYRIDPEKLVKILKLGKYKD